MYWQPVADDRVMLTLDAEPLALSDPIGSPSDASPAKSSNGNPIEGKTPLISTNSETSTDDII